MLPLRERILLTKYAVGAVVLLALNIFVGLVLILGTVITGHSIDVAGVAVSLLLFFLSPRFGAFTALVERECEHATRKGLDRVLVIAKLGVELAQRRHQIGGRAEQA